LLLGQTTQLEYRFRVYLKDKGSDMEYSVVNPQSFLSKRAIERKRKEQVDIDSTDYLSRKIICRSLQMRAEKLFRRVSGSILAWFS
jgi:hypothetical protein